MLNTLASSPDVMMSPENPKALHVRGGSSDQNLVLIDGIPSYNPYHAGGVLSALSPDVVSAVSMHAGVPSARFGDAISSVTKIRTYEPPKEGFVTGGAIGPTSLRLMAGVPLPFATLLIDQAGIADTTHVFNNLSNSTTWETPSRRATPHKSHNELTENQ